MTNLTKFDCISNNSDTLTYAVQDNSVWKGTNSCGRRFSNWCVAIATLWIFAIGMAESIAQVPDLSINPKNIYSNNVLSGSVVCDFIITASPAPTADLSVNVQITGIGGRSYTIPANQETHEIFFASETSSCYVRLVQNSQNPSSYTVGSPNSATVHRSAASKPGITLTIEESAVDGGDDFTVKVRATHAPSDMNGLDVMISFTDADSRLAGTPSMTVNIPKDAREGELTVSTNVNGTGSAGDIISVSVEDNVKYVVHTDVKTDSVAISPWSELSIKPKAIYKEAQSGLLECFFIISASPPPAADLTVHMTTEINNGQSGATQAGISAGQDMHEFSLDSNSSKCEAQLGQNSSNPTSYIIGSPSSATVYRSAASKPGITLTIDEASVDEGDDFTVKVMTTHAPTDASGLNVMVSYSDTDSRLDGTPSMTINIPKDATEGELTVSTNAKRVEGTISVSVEDNANYVVHSDARTDSVAITVPPEVSIKPKNVYSTNVFGNQFLCDFIITASSPPTANLPVQIDGGQLRTIPANQKSFEFTVISASGATECEARLVQNASKPTSYAIGSPSSATVYKSEVSKPGITLTIDDTSVYEGEDFTVKVKATHAPTDANGLDVMISFTDTGSRLDGTPSMTINIPKDATEGELTVSTNVKKVAGTISVSVENHANYVVHPDAKTDSVAIAVTPELFIKPKNNYEEEKFGGILECFFIVSASPPPVAELTVHLTTVINNEQSGKTQIRIPPNQNMHEITVVSNSSMCEAELVQNSSNPASYIIGSPSSATVHKSGASKPGISMTIDEPSVDGGDDFTVKIEATHAPTDANGLDVMISFTDTGSRLEGTPSMTINIPKDATEGELTVSTNVSGTTSVGDIISVSVEDNANYVAHTDVKTDSVAITPWSELSIRPKNVYSDDVGRGFLGCDFIITASPPPTLNMQFLISGGHLYTILANQGILEITTQNRASDASECEAQLLRNLSNPTSYIIGSPSSATVHKAEISKPGITLTIDETAVYEGEDFTVKIETTHAPTDANGLDVMISFTDADSRLQGTPSMTVNIRKDATEGELTVSTNAKRVAGTISVSVEDNAKYVVHPDAKTDSVAIAVPSELSIKPKSVYSDDVGSGFLGCDFIITASPAPTADLPVQLNGGRLYTFPANQGTHEIATQNQTSDATVCEVQLLQNSSNPSSYIIGSPSSATVHKSESSKPGITLTIDETTVDGGDDFTVKVKATHAPSEMNGLDVMISFTDADTRLEGTPSMTINIPKDATEGELTVSTNAKKTDSTISVSVADNANYIVHSDVKTDSVAVNALSVARIPKLSIQNATNVTAGGIAEFEITSDIQIQQALSVNYIPTNVSGSFLDETSGAANATRMSILTFSTESPFTATISVKTMIDSTSDEGVIRITLVDDTENSMSTNYSIIESNSSAFVTVVNGAPAIWFGVSTTGVRVTDGMVSLAVKSIFLPSSSNTPANSLAVRYRSTNVVGNFLGADNNSDMVQTVVFALDEEDQTVSGTLDVNLSQGSNGETEGSFTVSLLDDESNPVTYTVAPTGNVAIVNVTDVATVSIDRASGNEGDMMVFTVELSARLTQDLTIGWEVEIGMGDSAITADFTGNGLPSGSLIIRSGSTTPETALMVGIRDDTVEELAETFTVKLASLAFSDSSPTRGVVVFAGGSSSVIATGTINASDQPVTNEITISAGPSIGEGEDAIFTIRSSQGANTEVMIATSQDRNHIFLPVPTAVSLVNGLFTLRIPTFDNTEADPDGFLMVTLIDGNDYNIPEDRDDRSATVVVRDNDPAGGDTDTRYSVAANVISSILLGIPATPSPPVNELGQAASLPAISITANSGSVEEGETAVFTFTASRIVQSNITLKIKLSQSGDFVIGPKNRTVDLEAESLETELVVDTDDDGLAEFDGQITATLLDGNGYLVGLNSSAHVVVSDASDRQHRKNRVTGAIQVVVPDLLANSTAGTLGITADRVEQAFNGSPATSIELNGKSQAKAMLRSGGKMLNDSDADWRSIIDGSSFTVALYPEGGETSSATLWGVGDKYSLSRDGKSEQQSWDGETHTGHFGFDAQVGNRILTGLAMSVSNAEIDYGKDADSKLSLATLTQGVHPYVGFSSLDGESSMQILAGYGVNEIDLKQEGYSPEFLNGQYQTVGISGSNLLYSSSRFGWAHNMELNVVGNAWHVQQSVNSTGGLLDGLQTSASHFRIAVQESNDFNLGAGGTIAPNLLFGLRGDSRNEESVFGFEAGSEIKYVAFKGLEVAGSGRLVQSGLNRVHGWEIGSSLDYDSGNDGKGVLFSIASSWSDTDSDVVQHIWENELVGTSSDSFASNEADSTSGEFGFGFEVMDGTGLLTPFFEIEQSAANSSEYRVGSRFATGTGIRIELGAMRDIPESGNAGNSFNLTGSINW